MRQGTCRRAALLTHFDDDADPAPEERCCDHCDPPADLNQVVVPDAVQRARPAATGGRRGTASSAVKALERLSHEERGRYDALRVWRGATAKAIGWPAFRVSPNRALAAIAVRDPHTEDELASVTGVGPWLVETYGEAVLDVLEQVRSEG